MKILVACEFSGVVRDAFLREGHYAVSCDLLPSESDFGEHYQGDVLDIINEGWDMMIAHPPCTFLSNAGASRLFSKKGVDNSRLSKGIEAAKFFNVLLESNIKHICIENPVPIKIFGLPKYTQIIQPYYFGHPYSKRTCLWLKELPKLKPTNIITDGVVSYVSGGSKNKDGTPRKNMGTKIKSPKERSRTFSGIAKAMAEQWGRQFNDS